MSAVVVITGGRDFVPSRWCSKHLRSELLRLGAVALFEGDAQGADRWASGIARNMRPRIPVHTVPALWGVQDKAAGPIRNGRMLQWAILLGAELNLPVLLLAFPGGRGTADMVKRAQARGVDVVPFSDGGTP